MPTATAEPVVELKVYITGAVRNPGVYDIEQGSRLAQVVEAAGGATDDADLIVVNLAARVTDEEHWHIPRQGEVTQAPLAMVTTPQADSSGSQKININSATAEELVDLPEIGETLAQRIVDYREANGPFSSVDDLIEVRGIGSATLDAIRDLVKVR